MTENADRPGFHSVREVPPCESLVTVETNSNLRKIRWFTPPPSERHRFEYRVTRSPGYSVDDLNRLGDDGWELVSILAIPSADTDYYEYHFKRRIA
jgi:hypothetical protein